MLINEIISTSHMAPLYHGMQVDKTLSVLNTDYMPANWQHNIPGVGRVNGNSFSRNKLYGINTDIADYFIQLTIDRVKLAHDHKIIPLNAELVWRLAQINNRNRKNSLPIISDPRKMPDTVQRSYDIKTPSHDRNKRNPMARMDEEFVVGNIKNLHRYITSIRLISDASLNKPPEAVALMNYVNKFNIPLEGRPADLKRLKKLEDRGRARLEKGKAIAQGEHPDPAAIADKWEKFHNNVPNQY